VQSGSGPSALLAPTLEGVGTEAAGSESSDTRDGRSPGAPPIPAEAPTTSSAGEVGSGLGAAGEASGDATTLLT
jgi:hypothetical protein